MIILKPIETNILKGPLWLAQLQIPRFLFKLMKVMGTTCVGMDRQCNWKGQFENWSWGNWHYHPESPVKSLLQIPRPGFLEPSYTCQKIFLTLNLKKWMINQDRVFFTQHIFLEIDLRNSRRPRSASWFHLNNLLEPWLPKSNATNSCENLDLFFFAWSWGHKFQTQRSAGFNWNRLL